MRPLLDSISLSFTTKLHCPKGLFIFNALLTLQYARDRLGLAPVGGALVHLREGLAPVRGELRHLQGERGRLGLAPVGGALVHLRENLARNLNPDRGGLVRLHARDRLDLVRIRGVHL